MKTRSAVRLVLALALAAAFFSCTAQGGSIYATIETEQKINVSTLDQTITILDIVKVTTAPLPYFVAAGAVYDGTPPDANNEIGWPRAGHDPVAVRPPASGALCEALTYFPFTSQLYGGFFSDGPGMGLFKSGTTSPAFSTAVAFAGQQVTLLRTDPSDAAHILFAVIATPANSGTSGFTYGLWFSSDGTNFLQATTSAAVSLTALPRITGVAFLAGRYYVTSGSTLYSGVDATHLDIVSAVVVGNKSELLQDVTTDSDTNLVLLPSDNGRVYFSADNGTTWAFGNTNDNLNGRSISFLTVSTHSDTSLVATGHKYLVGTDGAGFYYLDTATVPPSLDRYSDVTVTGLYAGSVRKILIDKAQSNMVFMGTAGTGLWRAYFDPALGEVNSNWVHE